MSKIYQPTALSHRVDFKKRSSRTRIAPMKQRNTKQAARIERVSADYSTWKIPGLAHEDRETLLIGKGALPWSRTLAVALVCGEAFHDHKPKKRGAARVLIATTRQNVAEELASIVVREGWLPLVRISVQLISFIDDELVEQAALSRTVKATDPEFVFAELPDSFAGDSISLALTQIRAALGDLNAPILCPVAINAATGNQISFAVEA